MLERDLPLWGLSRNSRSSRLFWFLGVALSEALLCLLAWTWVVQVPYQGAALLVVGTVAIQLVAAVAWLYPAAVASRSGSRRPREFHPVKAALGIVVVFLSAAVGFYVLAVLFGAPFTQKITETLLFSVHMAALTTLPLAATHDTSPKGLRHIFSMALGDSSPLQGNWSSERRTRLLVRASRWAVIGAWAAAAALPLDWDRPWQQWPCPCVLGASVGHMAGLLLPMRRPGVSDYIT